MPPNHALRRSAERNQAPLEEQDLEKLIQMIQQGRGVFIHRDSPTRTIWLVRYLNKLLLPVYDSREKRISTFLPIQKFLQLVRKEEARLAQSKKPRKGRAAEVFLQRNR